MKKLLTLTFCLFAIMQTIFSQQQYETITANGSHVLKGFISRKILESDTAFSWYAENKKAYVPNKDAVRLLKENKDSIRLFVFMGTWCGDSHFIIPKFYSLLDAASFPKEKVNLIAVDENKKTIGGLTDDFNIQFVPTIIFLKDGKEIGRIVEYGKSGKFDQDIADILKN